MLWFMLPPESMAHDLQFQALLASRFLSDLALQSLLFAVLIATARRGGTALEASLVGVAFLAPGMLLGLFGGAVADALPKRVELAGAYLAMGALCLLLPLPIGRGFAAQLMVLFAVRVLHQVAHPAEASAAPLVATQEKLASANSFLSLVSFAGEVGGKALLAPLVVGFWGESPVTVMTGLLFLLSALRVVRFRPLLPERPMPRRVSRPHIGAVTAALHWLVRMPGAFWMLMLAAMASTVGVALWMLGPQYVQQVLGVDPEHTFYVFAPASVGVLLGLLLAIRLLHERLVAAVGFAIVSGAMSALGQISAVTHVFGWALVIEPPRLSEQVEMAGLLSLFIGLGMTLAAAATQTYVGRHVPLAIHGRVFAILGTMKDGLAMPLLLLLGAVAALVGVR
ncbi:MAG: MFS transporter [Dehalococcoidia bacterium]|nr:MFS transporter [Dehalococcoidia bacterium]